MDDMEREKNRREAGLKRQLEQAFREVNEEEEQARELEASLLTDEEMAQLDELLRQMPDPPISKELDASIAEMRRKAFPNRTRETPECSAEFHPDLRRLDGPGAAAEAAVSVAATPKARTVRKLPRRLAQVAACFVALLMVGAVVFPNKADASWKWIQSLFTQDYQTYTRYSLSEKQLHDYAYLAKDTGWSYVDLLQLLPDSYAYYTVEATRSRCIFIFKKGDSEDYLKWSQKISNEFVASQLDTEDADFVEEITILGMPGQKIGKDGWITYRFHNESKIYELYGKNISDDVMKEIAESMIPVKIPQP